MIPREIRLLMKKEWRQLRANRVALGTSLIPPTLFLVLLPSFLISATAAAGPGTGGRRGPPIDLGLIGDLGRDPGRVPIYLLPFFAGMAGTILPVMLAVHAVITERETRTFELLVALPVRLFDVLAAKMLTVMLFSSVVAGTALAVPLLQLAFRGSISLPEVLALYFELFCAMAAGTTSALMVAFHARDFRTAQNVTGIYVVPFVMITVVVALVVGGSVSRPLVLGAVYALLSAVLLAHAARQSAYEKLLR